MSSRWYETRSGEQTNPPIGVGEFLSSLSIRFIQVPFDNYRDASNHQQTPIGAEIVRGACLSPKSTKHQRRHRDSTSSGTPTISTFKRSRTAASKIHMREISSDGAQGPPTHQLWSAFSKLTNAQAYQFCSPAACQFAGRTPSRSEWSGSRHRSIDTVRSSAGLVRYRINADST